MRLTGHGLGQSGRRAESAPTNASGTEQPAYPPAVELTAYLVAVGHHDVRIDHTDGQLIIVMPEAPSAQAAARVAALDGSVVTTGSTTTVRIPAPD